MRVRVFSKVATCGLVVLLGVVSPRSAVAAQRAQLASQTETGGVSGSIVTPSAQQHPMSLFLENVETGVVTIVSIAPGQETYSAVVPAGEYRAFVWLPDFDMLGAFTTCVSDPSCTAHDLVSIQVLAGETRGGVDIADWFVPEDPLVVLSGRLVDGSGAEPMERGMIVIWRRHIMAVGSDTELSIPGHALHNRLQGMTIMPGFINAHVHNAYGPRNLTAWAESGVTTIRDLGAPVNLPWDVFREIFETDLHNAGILAAGPLVTCPDGYPIVPIGFASLTVDSEEQAREEINSLIDRGADVIKIVIESGVQEVLSEELATVIVDTAHARGIPVTVHLNRVRDLRTALAAGVDDVAHMALDYVPNDVIQEMVDADVGWVPTLQILSGNGNRMYDNLRRFVEAGGRVGLGNDAGYLQGVIIGMPLPEIEQMEFAGMTPMQIIVAATSDAAVICNRQQLIGSLEAGKIADVLVVEGDPLADLRTLENVRLVMNDGVIIRHEYATPRHPIGRADP